MSILNPNEFSPDATAAPTPAAPAETTPVQPVTGDLPLAQPPAAPVPTQQYDASQMLSGQQTKGDLWRKILGTVMTSIAGGMMAPDEHPEQSFSFAQRAMDLRAQQQFENQRVAHADERAQRVADLDAERVGLERERLQILKGDSEVMRASAALSQLKMSREIEQMPEEMRLKYQEFQGRYIAALSAAGLQIAFTAPDDPAGLSAVVQEMGHGEETGGNQAPDGRFIDKGGLMNTYMPIHDEANNRVIFFQRKPAFDVFPATTPPIVLPSGQKVELANRPINTTDALIHYYAAYDAAKMNRDHIAAGAAARAQEKQQNSWKSSYLLARREILGDVTRERDLKASDRKYKSESDVELAVKKRTQEIYDGALGYERQGSENPFNTTIIESALQGMINAKKSRAEVQQAAKEFISKGAIDPASLQLISQRLDLDNYNPPPSAWKKAATPIVDFVGDAFGGMQELFTGNSRQQPAQPSTKEPI
jgi:hypothetical protein